MPMMFTTLWMFLALVAVGQETAGLDTSHNALPQVTVQYDGPYSRSTLGVRIRITFKLGSGLRFGEDSRVRLNGSEEPASIDIKYFGESGSLEERVDLLSTDECSMRFAGRDVVYEKPAFHYSPEEDVQISSTQEYRVSVSGGGVEELDGTLPEGVYSDEDEWLVTSIAGLVHVIKEVLPQSDEWKWLSNLEECSLLAQAQY